ncbi:unnamed protein product [Lactuca virosa]|uniref:NAC domain-containing protein n=1 Tax=Lactuca virosa TaxID=75947 RepID=A0AAU9NYH6_9ASTR|nr:unnamed protein product [Lactuca virosa]
MSPPSSSPHEIENVYWTDEGICMSLLDFKNGKSLPSNVESEVNPYKYRPQDLPGDLWYFCSVVKTESEFGFWVETGEPCEIFSNSAICGFRTTFRFYEGKTPHERKTDWVMQEYKINVNDHKALSRIFFAVENSSDMECILTGDFFELNDLVDAPGSCSSSSANSSCLTMTSDEYFDSIALLQQLDDDENMKDSSIKFNLSATINSKLVICPTTTVSVKSETCEAKEEDMNKSTSIGVINTSTESSSSSSEGMFEEDKKESVSKKKRRKMMKYFCFLAF